MRRSATIRGTGAKIKSVHQNRITSKLFIKMDDLVSTEGNDKSNESKDNSSSNRRYLMGSADCSPTRDTSYSVHG